MTHKLTVDIGNFKEGRVGSLVESPLALMQLTSHYDDDLVPARETVEETFHYFMPVIAANEPSSWRGIIIPVERHEVALMTAEGKTPLDRAEVYDNARIVNCRLSNVGGVTREEFDRANKRNNELLKEYPEQFKALQKEITDLMLKKSEQANEKFEKIITLLGLADDISTWNVADIENYIAEAKKEPEGEILITAMLGASNIHRVFDFAREDFINAS